MDLSQVESLGTEPIAGESPTGENAQGDDAFTRITDSFRALTSMEARSSDEIQAAGESRPTWKAIGEDSFTLLKDRSKDMRLASYLTIALFHEEGFNGLAAGLKVMRGLLENFWENLFPPLRLMRGRKSALEFIVSAVAGGEDGTGGLLRALGGKELEAWDETRAGHPSDSQFDKAYAELQGKCDAVKDAGESLKAIVEKVYELFPDEQFPLVSPLVSTLEAVERDLNETLERDKKPDPSAEPSAAGGASADAGGARPAAAASRPAAALPEAAPESAADIYDLLVKVAPVLRKENPSGPAAYRLMRMGVWGEVTEAPPVSEGNTTRIPQGALNDTLVESMNALADAGNWAELLEQAENRFSSAPFWFDLQYFVARALEGMGPAYKEAAGAVSSELLSLLVRLPKLIDLTFDKGLPFASGATRAWIESEAQSGGSNGAMPDFGSGGSGGGGDEELTEALGEARTLAAQGNLLEACNLLQAGSSGSKSLRTQFVRRTAMARLVQQYGSPRLGQPMWESLLSDIDRYGLEQWEPELCIPVLQALNTIYSSDKRLHGQADEIFARICRADVATALRLEKK